MGSKSLDEPQRISQNDKEFHAGFILLQKFVKFK